MQLKGSKFFAAGWVKILHCFFCWHWTHWTLSRLFFQTLCLQRSQRKVCKFYFFTLAFLVPWRYVHPQTDHATFRPTPFHPLWQFTIVTIRPLNILLLWQMDPVTIYYCDTPTPWHFTTVTDGSSDNLLLWQSDPLTFYYCDRWTQWHFTTATLRHPLDTSR